MNAITALSQEEIQQQLAAYPDWQYVNEKLYRRLMFEDFIHAFGFMTQVAIIAEKMNHHPEWANIYRTIDIYLTTHDAGGVSEKDFALIKEIETLIGLQKT